MSDILEKTKKLNEGTALVRVVDNGFISWGIKTGDVVETEPGVSTQ